MSYPAVKALMEANPKITRKEVMKAVGCGDLQAAAWMQRFTAEKATKKDIFDGKYKGSPPKPINQKREEPPIKKRITRSGRVIG